MSKLMNVNDLLGLTNEDLQEDSSNQDRLEVSISNLIPFHNHPFRLYKGERLDDMVESIREYGIITPLIVRKLEDDKYEILSGHNSANAGKLAGLSKLPVVIKEDLTDEEAMLIVTEKNLIQRSFSELLHSEKARILRERYNAIKKQRRRTDLIKDIENLRDSKKINEELSSRQLGERKKSDKEIGKTYDLSPRNVSRYLRIDTLINELKEKIDINVIPFNAGVDLSFLNKDEQKIVSEILNKNKYKISLKKSNLLKRMAQENKFNKDIAFKILSGEYFKKSKEIQKPKFINKFTNDVIKKYVTEERDIKEVEEILMILLEDYFSE